MRAAGEGAFAFDDTLGYVPAGPVTGQLERSSCVAATGRMLLAHETMPEAYIRGIADVTTDGGFTNGFHALVVDSVEDGWVHIRDPLPEGDGSAYKVAEESFRRVWNGQAVIKVTR